VKILKWWRERKRRKLDELHEWLRILDERGKREFEKQVHEILKKEKLL